MNIKKITKNNNLTPIRCYVNPLKKQISISIENRNKTGIYRWVNIFNNNTYVGSGLNLSKRIGDYFKKSELIRNKSPIHTALLKYGYVSFNLEILEYCDPSNLIEREQYYLDLLKPKYNILTQSYSLQGYKHTPENIEKFKQKKISDEDKNLLSLIHKGKEVSEETRDKLAIATSNYRKNNPLTPLASANIRGKTTKRVGVSITIINTQSKKEKKFETLTKAGEFLGVKRQAVRNAINTGGLIKGLYRVYENK